MSAPFTLSGEIECKGGVGAENRYLLKYNVTNKSDCVLALQSLSLLNQVVKTSSSRIEPKTTQTGMSVGFGTSVKTPPPSETKISATVQYTLNGRKCTETFYLLYRRCH